jgi:hypothetical protein
VAVAALVTLAGACSQTADADAGSAASRQSAPEVTFSSSSSPAPVDSSGEPLVALPTNLPIVPLLGTRVRSLDYAYSVPAAWSQVQATATPTPDTMIAPDDPELPVYIAVDKPFRVEGMSQADVVSRLRNSFTGEGEVRPTWDRDVAGFTATGLLIDASERTRHVYAIVIYAERVYPIRVTYDPTHEREALAAYETLLASWTWT